MEVSAGVIVRDLSNQTYLCVRAFNNWDFPKGHVEKGESLIQAAMRELEEETTLSSADAALLGLMSPPVIYKNGKKTAHYFLANRTSDKTPFLPINPEIGKPENDSFAWFTMEQMEKFMPSRLAEVISWIGST